MNVDPVCSHDGGDPEEALWGAGFGDRAFGRERGWPMENLGSVAGSWSCLGRRGTCGLPSEVVCSVHLGTEVGAQERWEGLELGGVCAAFGLVCRQDAHTGPRTSPGSSRTCVVESTSPSLQNMSVFYVLPGKKRLSVQLCLAIRCETRLHFSDVLETHLASVKYCVLRKNSTVLSNHLYLKHMVPFTIKNSIKLSL